MCMAGKPFMIFSSTTPKILIIKESGTKKMITGIQEKVDACSMEGILGIREYVVHASMLWQPFKSLRSQLRKSQD